MPSVNGLPSVTEILEAVGLGYTMYIPKERRDYYLKRGRALHAAIEMDATGDLDEASIHPDIAGRFQAYRKFVKHTAHVVVHSELELIHSRWSFVGHLDRVGRQRGSRLAIIDWKSSVDPEAVALQLAGYALLWRDKFPDEKIDDHIALQLKEDGDFVAHTIDTRPYEQTFLASLLVVRAKAARAKKPTAVPV